MKIADVDLATSAQAIRPSAAATSYERGNGTIPGPS